MKVNFNTTLKDFRGNDLKDPQTGEIQPMNEWICSRLYVAGEGLTDDERYAAYLLMEKIRHTDSDVDITDRESLLIKKALGKNVPVGIYGQIVKLLNGD